MKKTLYQSLTKQVKQMIYFYEIDHFSSQINSLLEEQKLTQLEYDSLLKIAKKQLKHTLDLNLLPNYEYIFKILAEKYNHYLIKIDAGEIVEAEFEIIEQEARKLNQARVKYIQDNFLKNSR